MITKLRAGVAAAALGTLLAGAVIAAPGAPAATQVEYPVTSSAGTLSLRTGATDAVTWTAPDDSTRTQSITGGGNNCAFQTGGDQLLTFSAGGGRVGFRDDSLGVAEPGILSFLTCHRVNPLKAPATESLTLALNRDAVTLANNLGPVFGTEAALDLELKKDSHVRVSLFLGSEQVGLVEVGPSTSAWTSLPPGVAYLKIICSKGDWANQLVTTPAGVLFDRITLTAVTGAFSLEGGADGAGAAAPASTIALVQKGEGAIDCGTTVNDDGVAVTRIGNADPSDECTPFPYQLDRDGSEVSFYKPGSVDGTAQFAIEVEWSAEPGVPGWGTATPTYSPRTNTVLPVTRINYEATASSPDVYLGWCLDPVFDVQEGTGQRVLTGLETTPGAAQDQDATLSGVQYACVASDNSYVDAATDLVLTTQWVYLYGDARLRY